MFATLCCSWNGFLLIFLHWYYVCPVYWVRWVHLVDNVAYSAHVAEAVSWICPSLIRIFILPPLSCVFTIHRRKPTGKGSYCHCKKSWGIKKKNNKTLKLKAFLLFLICGQSLCCGNQPLCLVEENLEVHSHGFFSSKFSSHCRSHHHQDVTVCVPSPHTGIFLYNSKPNLIFT